LRAVIEDTQGLTGRQIERVYVDKGYRGHDAPNPRRVLISGQKRGVFGAIKRELRRRSAIEPLIGNMNAGRCYLKGRAGDAANAVLTAVGYNFRRILAWLRMLLRLILSALFATFAGHPASIRLLNGRSRRKTSPERSASNLDIFYQAVAGSANLAGKSPGRRTRMMNWSLCKSIQWMRSALTLVRHSSHLRRLALGAGIGLPRTAPRLTVHKSVPAVRIHLAPPSSPSPFTIRLEMIEILACAVDFA
jgi:hypothetical protein